MNSRKLLVASAVALALLTFLVAVVQLFQPHPDAAPPATAFSARFQPQLEVRAGIGSTRDLTPVQLDPPKPASPVSAHVPTEGGRHASTGNQR